MGLMRLMNLMSLQFVKVLYTCQISNNLERTLISPFVKNFTCYKIGFMNPSNFPPCHSIHILWYVNTHRSEGPVVLRNHEGCVSSCSFSKDGEMVALL